MNIDGLHQELLGHLTSLHTLEDACTCGSGTDIKHQEILEILDRFLDSRENTLKALALAIKMKCVFNACAGDMKYFERQDADRQVCVKMTVLFVAVQILYRPNFLENIIN